MDFTGSRFRRDNRFGIGDEVNKPLFRASCCCFRAIDYSTSMPKQKRKYDDVMNEALATHLRNEAKKKKNGTKRTSRKTAGAPLRSKKTTETDFLPTTSEDEESVMVPRIAKKRRVDDHLIAKDMAESGELFGGVAIPSKKKSPPKTPPSTKKTERKPPARPTRLTERRTIAAAAARPSVVVRPASAASKKKETRPAPQKVPAVPPGPREFSRIRREVVIPRRNEVVVQDITDDEATEMPEELTAEDPIVASADKTNDKSPAMNVPFSLVMIVSLLVAVASVMVAMFPTILTTDKLNAKKMVTSVVSFTCQGLSHLMIAIMNNIWRLVLKLWGLWVTCFKTHPLATLSLTFFGYWLITTFYCYRYRKRRKEITQGQVVATRNKVYEELFNTHQPIDRDIIFARLAFEKFPTSGVRRNAFKNDIWTHVVLEVEGDPRVSVEKVILSGRSRVHWSWVDPLPPTCM